MSGAASPPAAARIGDLERRYLSSIFVELCRIDSPSRAERACAERVRDELHAIGLEVSEDDAGAAIGGDCGNLLARIPQRRDGNDGASERPAVLLCAHLDTVPALAPIDPVLEDGYWENANDAILGADNKAAIAVLLALARHLASDGAPLPVELLFTVGEEIALAGSEAFDTAALTAKRGYVFDHASPIGELIVESPCHYRIQASFHGAAAHAGIRPQEGRSAILAASRAVAALPHGLIEGRGTVNVGTIEGGTAINVVPEHARLLAEVRGLDDPRGEELVADVIDAIHRAANDPECDCDVDVQVQRTFSGYRLASTSEPLRAADAALRVCGYEPARIASGGGSDANTLIAKGIATVNLANGTERNHEPGERVADAALQEMLAVSLALLDELAALTPSPAL
ncbi:MAG TPA: M20/M25/M40 family metallo-hydrolase [Solirubrobacteraceae bacterium]